MPRRKPKNKETKQGSKKKEQELKDQLDSILLVDDMLKDLSHPDIPPIRKIRTIDLDTAKSEVESEARSIMESLSRFFNGGEEMDETSYIRHKQKIDALSISTMALQIRTAQHAIAKLVDEIDSGETDPKMFAVLAQLQNQIMQMPKNFSDYMSQMESSYKSLKKDEDTINSSGDLKIDSEGNIIDDIESEGKLKVRGTKTLMESLQATIKKQGEIKEAEFEEDDNLINPLKKDEGVDALGDKLVDGEENVDFDDDMF